MKIDRDGYTVYEIVYVSVFNGRTIKEEYHSMDDVRHVKRCREAEGCKIIKADC